MLIENVSCINCDDVTMIEEFVKDDGDCVIDIADDCDDIDIDGECDGEIIDIDGDCDDDITDIDGDCDDGVSDLDDDDETIDDNGTIVVDKLHIPDLDVEAQSVLETTLMLAFIVIFGVINAAALLLP